jgi:hypothetical protein
MDKQGKQEDKDPLNFFYVKNKIHSKNNKKLLLHQLLHINYAPL